MDGGLLVEGGRDAVVEVIMKIMFFFPGAAHQYIYTSSPTQPFKPILLALIPLKSPGPFSHTALTRRLKRQDVVKMHVLHP